MKEGMRAFRFMRVLKSKKPDAVGMALDLMVGEGDIGKARAVIAEMQEFLRQVDHNLEQLLVK